MKMLLVLILMAYFLVIPGLAQVNGSLEEIEGKTVLTVFGTHYERGYAHGFLLAEETKLIFESYFLGHVCSGQAWIYNSARLFFESNYSVETQYRLEAQGMLEGISAAGVDLNNTTLGREVDATDLLVVNAIVDLSQSFEGLQALHLGCSSMSSWGSSTANDSTLAGDLIITRLMDWENHPALSENHLLLVSKPSEEDEQPWVSLTFPGFVGALSAVNEAGISCFMNMGNRINYSIDDPFYPILFTVRNGLEHRDYNGDGENTSEDITAAIEDRNRSGASIVHVTGTQGDSLSAVIIECNNERGVAIRDVSFNTMVPGEHLVATNHFRKLYDPSSCYRYQAIADSLTSGTDMSPDRSWSIMSNAAGVLSNLHAIQYIESPHLLLWATSTMESPAHQQEPVLFDIDQLFDPVGGVDIDWVQGQLKEPVLLSQNYPNPFGSVTTISFTLACRSHCRMSVYSLDGRRIATMHDGMLDEGTHSFLWNGRNEMGARVSKGAYLCRLATDLGSSTIGLSYVE